MQRFLFAAGAVLGLLAVAMAALAAHVLRGLPAGGMALVQTALQMQGWHALALLGCALWLPRGGRVTVAAGLCLLAGTVIFCGVVYALGLGHAGLDGAAPVGGTLLMLGWALLAAAGLRRTTPQPER